MRGKPTTFASVAIGVALACATHHSVADEEAMPDEDLLEFLGNWENGDQDWLTIALEMAMAEDVEASGRSAGSAETDDEYE